LYDFNDVSADEMNLMKSANDLLISANFAEMSQLEKDGTGFQKSFA